MIPMCEILWLMDIADSSASAIALALPNIVAFLSAVVAATAVYVNRKMARDTLKQQLLLTHDERIWQQRSEAYLQLFMLMDELDSKLGFITSDSSTLHLLSETSESSQRTEAAIRAFGSIDVAKLFTLWRSANGEFASILNEIFAMRDKVMELNLDADSTASLLQKKVSELYDPLNSVHEKLSLLGDDIKSQVRYELQILHSAESGTPPELASLKRGWDPDKWAMDKLAALGKNERASAVPSSST